MTDRVQIFDPGAVSQFADADGSPISCARCAACCCRLEVMLIGDNDVPDRFTAMDRWGGWVMRRLDDGWCAALDRETLRCSIYDVRPGICRDFEMGESDCRAERSWYLLPDPVHREQGPASR